MGVSKNRGTQNGWFIMEHPIKMDNLGVPLFLETPICIHMYITILVVRSGGAPQSIHVRSFSAICFVVWALGSIIEKVSVYVYMCIYIYIIYIYQIYISFFV